MRNLKSGACRVGPLWHRDPAAAHSRDKRDRYRPGHRFRPWVMRCWRASCRAAMTAINNRYVEHRAPAPTLWSRNAAASARRATRSPRPDTGVGSAGGRGCGAPDRAHALLPLPAPLARRGSQAPAPSGDRTASCEARSDGVSDAQSRLSNVRGNHASRHPCLCWLAHI